jgi:hypothetical protein
MVCPNCKCEYIEGIKECVDCKIPLVEESTVETELKENYPGFVTLKKFPDHYEALLAQGYLNSYAIDSYVPPNSGDAIQTIIKNTCRSNLLMVKPEYAGEAAEVFNRCSEHSAENTKDSTLFKRIVKIICAIILLGNIFVLGAIFRKFISLLF